MTTLFGRIRRIPELRARQRQTRLLGERLAVNTVIQGTAADIIKVAMVRPYRALQAAGLDTRLVLQIHDELLFEAPEPRGRAASAVVAREMAGAYDSIRRWAWTSAWVRTPARGEVVGQAAPAAQAGASPATPRSPTPLGRVPRCRPHAVAWIAMCGRPGTWTR